MSRLRSSNEFLRKPKRPPRISKQDRVALIRKANVLYNAGKHPLAERIYETTGYADGLIRIAGREEKAGNFLEALRLYWLANDHRKTSVMSKKLAQGIRYLMKSDTMKEMGKPHS